MDTQCQEPDCDRQVKPTGAQGRCRMHYLRWRRSPEFEYAHLHRLSEFDTETRTALCSECGVVKIWKATRRNGEARYVCSSAHRKHVRRGSLKRKYGISPEQFAEMVAAQQGACAGGCGRPCTHVDHDHETGHVRGLLCNRCNVAIGLADEDPDQLRRLADYVLKHGFPVPG